MCRLPSQVCSNVVLELSRCSPGLPAGYLRPLHLRVVRRPPEPWFSAVDIQADRTIAAYSFSGCYFESPTHSILRRTVPPINTTAHYTGG